MTDAPEPVNSIVPAADMGQNAGMKPPVFLAAWVLSAAACGPLAVYHRPGVSVTRMQQDTTECEVQALRDAPVANQVRQAPPLYFPGERVCNAAGACWTTPGYWLPGAVRTVDVNRDLRGRVTDMCMARRGYQPVSIPPCTARVRAAAPVRRTATLPPLGPRSCVIRHDDGGWQIVTPQAPAAKS